MEGGGYLGELGFHGVLDMVDVVLEPLDLLVSVGDETTDAVEDLLLVGLVALLVGGVGLYLEEVVDRAPFGREIVHGGDPPSIRESGGVAVAGQIQSGGSGALVPDVRSLRSIQPN
jgi:hypothetical protein